MKTYRTMILDADTNHSEALMRCFSQYPRLQTIAVLSNGAEALERIRAEKPDLLLMDLLLPGLDGLSLLREIQRMNEAPLVICLSEFSSRTSVEAASRHGAIYYLVKPVKMQTVASIVLECADISRQNRRAIECTDDDSESELRERIWKMMKDLGFSMRYLGSGYLAQAVELAYQSPIYLRNLNAGLYAELASRSDTTPACIERSLRTAIAAADADKALTHLIGCAPSNKACIQYLLNELKR